MTRKPRFRIVLADDHTIVAEGLALLVAADFELVAKVENGEKAVLAAQKFRPHVLFLDISMPVLNGIEACRRITGRNSAVRVIFLTMHADPMYIREAFRAGASGYLLKRSAASEIAAAVREVMAGRLYLTPLLAEFSNLVVPPPPGEPDVELLTGRQREVLELVSEGHSAKEIAHRLSISVKTAEFHKQTLMRKLGVHTAVELAKYAIQHGLSGFD